MANAILKDLQDNDQDLGDELAAGSTLMHGQYTIDSFLNAGGFGITYSARDSLDRRVVIKECFPGAFCRRSTALVTARSRAHQSELASIVRLFVQEARSMAKLNHPNIVGVHQVFEENNTAYMALDFVEGCDLLDVIENGTLKLSPEDIETILRKVLDAISFVHAQGLLHRDISPDNILLDQNKDPVLIDFGAAREQASKKSRVLSALRVVKDGYSPQEFYVTGSEQGPYSDLYALGATFYHLVTGKLPPDAQTRLSAVASGEKDPYRPLLNRLPTFRKPLLHSIDTAMAILPRDRIATSEVWLEMLDSDAPIKKPRVLTKRVQSKPVAATSAEQKTKSRKKLLLSSVALVGFFAVAITAAEFDLFSLEQTPQTAEAVDLPAQTPAATETAEAPAAQVPEFNALIAEAAREPNTVVDPANVPAATVDVPAATADELAIALDLPVETPDVPVPAVDTPDAAAVVPTPTDIPVATSGAPTPTVDVPVATVDVPTSTVDESVATADALAPTIDIADTLIDVPVTTPDVAVTTSDAPVEPTEPVASIPPIVQFEPPAPLEPSIDLELELALAAPLLPTQTTSPALLQYEPIAFAADKDAAPTEPAPAPIRPVARTIATIVEPALPRTSPHLWADETTALLQSTLASVDPGPALPRTSPHVWADEVPAPVKETAIAIDTTPTTEGQVNTTAPEGTEIAAVPAISTPDTEAASDPIETALPAEVVPAPEAEDFVEAPVAETPEPAVIAQAAEPAETFEVPGMSSTWTNAVPENWVFGLEGSGVRVFAVNGQPVASRQEFELALRQDVGVPSSSDITAQITLGANAEDAIIENWDFPIIQNTTLPNGLTFQTQVEDGSWVTKITEVPDAITANLLPGDVLFAHMGAGAFFTERTSLPLTLEAIVRGEIDTSVAVIRAGSTLATTLPINQDDK